MSTQIIVTGRNAALTAHVTQLGANARAKLYSGTKPANLGTPTGTLLATLTFGSGNILDANGGSAGSVANGVLTAGGYTQSNASHVTGTPTFIRWEKSDGSAYMDSDIGTGAGNVPFTGQVTNGANVTGPLTWTDGNA